MPVRAPRPVEQLTDEQLRATGSTVSGVYIDASPGSGKTQVSAFRFGALAFAAAPASAGDSRGVLATSFTRAATAELRRRVLHLWGPAALAWPNQVVTIDTIVGDLVTHLLEQGLLVWPGGHKRLQILDNWKTSGATSYSQWEPRLRVQPRGVVSTGLVRRPQRGHFLTPRLHEQLTECGISTHQDVRHVLAAVIGERDVQESIVERLRQRYRALIVDEVFDANDTDLSLVRLAAQAGADITLVGDPWQAVYDFRGANSAAVLPFVRELGLTPVPLRRSFRWETPQQERLATQLRSREGVTLEAAPNVGALDVVLSAEWKPLWSLGPQVLPLAFKSATSTRAEAAATLVLNRVTEQALGLSAVFFDDALATLMLDEEVYREIETDLDEVLHRLEDGTAAGDLGKAAARAAKAAWLHLDEVLNRVSPDQPLRAHKSHFERLTWVGERRSSTAAGLVLGLTVHQAKGGEWPVVGVHLSEAEEGRLCHGLDPAAEPDRKIYVACTRAKHQTYLVPSVAKASGK